MKYIVNDFKEMLSLDIKIGDTCEIKDVRLKDKIFRFDGTHWEVNLSKNYNPKLRKDDM